MFRSHRILSWLYGVVMLLWLLMWLDFTTLGINEFSQCLRFPRISSSKALSHILYLLIRLDKSSINSLSEYKTWLSKYQDVSSYPPVPLHIRPVYVAPYLYTGKYTNKLPSP